MNVPFASLIIPSRNRPELLLETVEAILQGSVIPAEIVIIDQSIEPHPILSGLTTERACDLRYRWSRTAGVSRARNEGITAAQYNILVFTDDDIIATPAWFETIVNSLLVAGGRSVVAGQVRPTSPASADGFAPSTITDQFPAVHKGRVRADVLTPHNMAMYRRAVEEVGGFDERLGAGTAFMNAEDNDLGFRLLEAGYCIKYVPEAVVYHRAWRTGKDYIPLRWVYGYGQGAFYAKYFTFNDRYMVGRMWADVARHGSRLFRYGLKRSFRQNYSDIVYILGLVCGAAKWLLTQRKMK